MAVVRSTYGGGSAKKGAGERAELQGPREALSGHVGEGISDMSPYRRPRRHRRQGGRRRERGSGETRLADLQTPQPNKRTNRRKRQHQQHDAHAGAFWVGFCLGVFAWLRVGRAVAALRRAAGFGWLASARGAVKGKGVVSGFQTSQNQLPTTSFRLAPQAASSSSTAPPRRRARALPRDGHADDRHRRQS